MAESRELLPSNGRVPPNDMDAEAAVLSAILLDPVSVDRVQPILRKEHFYANANALIYEAALELRMQGVPPDAVAVASYLRDRGRLGQVGGTPYIGQLADRTPSIANLEHHASIIWQKWRVRQAIAICQEGQAEGYSPIEDPREYLRKLEVGLAALSDESEGQKLEPLGDVLERALRDATTERLVDSKTAPTKTGFREFDRMMVGLYPTDLTILAARPGLGKTAFATGLAAAVARPFVVDGALTASSAAVAFFSLEMGREQIAMRFGCHEAKVDLHRMRAGKLSREDWTHLTTAQSEIAHMPIFVDDQTSLTLYDLRGKIRQLKRQLVTRPSFCQLKLVVVDYLQLMKGEVTRNSNREQEVASISRGLKAVAKDEHVAVLALSQLNRHVERQGNKRPGLADLRDSGAIEQDADNVIFLYRDDYYDKTTTNRGIAEVIAAKQRNGPTGSFEMKFVDAYARFYDLASEYAEDNDEYWDN